MSKRISELIDELRNAGIQPSELEWVNPGTDSSVEGLGHDSRTVAPGQLFIAIRGGNADGHDHLGTALEKGARALLLCRDRLQDFASLQWETTLMVSDDPLAVMAPLAASLLDHPEKAMDMIGVTGTNGKTTTTYLLEAILGQAAVIGTVNYRIMGREIARGGNTTPLSAELFSALAQARDQGARRAIMEVSSHGLDLHRVRGIGFRTAIFTNLTPEHLDFHGDMERYYQSKRRLFEMVLPEGYSIVNTACPSGRRLAEELQGLGRPVIATGPGSRQAVSGEKSGWVEAVRWTMDRSGIKGRMEWNIPGMGVSGEIDFASPLTGEFNLLNITGAWAAALSLGARPEQIAGTIGSFERVPGRFDAIQGPGFTVFVDYAHTGDSLANVLRCLQDLRSREGGRILTVFGCGGDRDPSKRPVMGRIAKEMSDLVIVTSDNPRTEDPLLIIRDILSGMEGFQGQVIADRAQAIETAVAQAEQGDFILVAGKGHEDYQILGREKIHFDDREVVAQAIARIHRGD